MTDMAVPLVNREHGRIRSSWRGTRPYQKTYFRSSCHGSVETNLTSNLEDVGSIPGFTWWVKNPVLP